MTLDRLKNIVTVLSNTAHTSPQIGTFEMPSFVIFGFALGAIAIVLKESRLGKLFRAALLPSIVRDNLMALPEEQREQFWEEYDRGCKSYSTIFFCWLLLGWHYLYLGKWGTQLLFWLTGGGFLVWWAVDSFRIWGLVGGYNKTVAVESLKNVKILSSTVMPRSIQLRKSS